MKADPYKDTQAEAHPLDRAQMYKKDGEGPVESIEFCT